MNNSEPMGLFGADAKIINGFDGNGIHIGIVEDEAGIIEEIA